MTERTFIAQPQDTNVVIVGGVLGGDMVVRYERDGACFGQFTLKNERCVGFADDGSPVLKSIWIDCKWDSPQAELTQRMATAGRKIIVTGTLDWLPFKEGELPKYYLSATTVDFATVKEPSKGTAPVRSAPLPAAGPSLDRARPRPAPATQQAAQGSRPPVPRTGAQQPPARPAPSTTPSPPQAARQAPEDDDWSFSKT